MKILVECKECKKEVLKMTAYQEWLSLFNYFECSYYNGEITSELFQLMIDRLCHFKPIIEEEFIK